MNVLGIIRIVSVVGLSAIKLISECIRVREAKKSGLINLGFANNNPYYQNRRPVYNQYDPQFMNQTPQWVSEYGYHQPQQQVIQQPVIQQTPMLMQQPTYGYSEPTVVQYIPKQPMVEQFSYQQPTASMYQRGSRRWLNNYMNYQPSNSMYIPQQQPMGYQQPIYSNMNIGIDPRPVMQGYGMQNELKWASKSLGQMEYERRQQQSVQHVPKAPMFNWQAPHLKWRPKPVYDNRGVVAMFYTDDGEPLFGPSPVVA